jgi:predicted N-acetyltransferase YhbS
MQGGSTDDLIGGARPMIELLEIRPGDLSGDLASAVYRLLRDAFPDDGPDEGDYYRKLGSPEVAVVVRDGLQVCGHLGIYTREVEVGNETLRIGMLGGIVVTPDRRQRGYCRLLVRRAHEHLKERRIPFSILFAYEPAYTRAAVTSSCKIRRISSSPMGRRGLLFIVEACTLSSRKGAGQIDCSICAARPCEWRTSAALRSHADWAFAPEQS